MTNKNKAFQATEYKPATTTTIYVSSINDAMSIHLENSTISITKQQAIDFWGLVEKEKQKNFLHFDYHDTKKDDEPKQEKCPVIDMACMHYTFQLDNMGQVAIEHCTNKNNKSDVEGNCLESLCPILVKNN